MKRIRKPDLCMFVALVAMMLGALSGVARAQTARMAIGGDIPAPIVQGQASLQGHHDPSSVLQINVGLAARESGSLDELIKAASTPGSPQYGHYLTKAQYMARYAPTDGEVEAVKAWLASQGLDVTGVSADNLLVHVSAPAAAAERAFAVTINDYKASGRGFYANDREPSVAANLNVHWVSGLSSYNVAKPATTCNLLGIFECSYNGGDLRAAYNVSGDGSGQTLGFTLWGQKLPQSDYTGYAEATGETPITVGGSGEDGLEFIEVDGSTTESDTDDEVALDTEIAHGVAPGIHETYWLGHDGSESTMEDVLNEAANSEIAIISNSWTLNEEKGCPADPNMETSLQQGAATGKTFYFATGDKSASAGCAYPADSQYGVAVGGTELNVGGGSSWSSEMAIENGGGCSNSEPRPWWQTGIGGALVYPSTPCTGRAEPDVSAESGGIGAYVYYDGSGHCCIQGTSLATPIWAAMSAVWNNNNTADGRPEIGFAAPLIYSLANDQTTYANDFHDITSGSNGFPATAGWDEATGWGSPDFNNLSNNQPEITYTGPTSASRGDTITLAASLDDYGTANGLSGRTITFTAAGETCEGTTDENGDASCSVTINDALGEYSVSATFAGDAAYEAVSTTDQFTVEGLPVAEPGWEVNYFAAGFYHTYLGPMGIVADAANNLYIDDAPNGMLYKFGAQGGIADLESQLSSTPIGDWPLGLAFGKDGELYAVLNADSEVVQVDPLTGEVVRDVAPVGDPLGIATDPVSGDLFVTSDSEGGVDRISEPASANPTVAQYASGMTAPDGISAGPDGTFYVEDEGNIDSVSATNSATPGQVTTLSYVSEADGIAVGANPFDPAAPAFVVANSNNGIMTQVNLGTPPLSTSPIFTGGTRGDFVTVAPDGCLYATQQSDVLRVSGTGGACPFSPISPFQPPEAQPTAPGAVTSTTADLQATVNPHGAATSFHFEYGTDLTYGNSTPESSAGSGSQPVTVSQTVTGLTPSTVYHYRVVAHNQAGTIIGPDSVLSTPTTVGTPSGTAIKSPTVITLPTITGQAVPGHTLTCSPGTWNDATGFSSSWIRDGGATVGSGSTYPVQITDVHHRLACYVQAHGPGGTTPAESATVTVQPANATFTIRLRAARATAATIRAHGEHVVVIVPQACKVTLRLLAVRVLHGKPVVKLLAATHVAFTKQGRKQVTFRLRRGALSMLTGGSILRVSATASSGRELSQPASVTIVR